MKIKTFSFFVCNNEYIKKISSSEYYEKRYDKIKVYTDEEIDSVVNEFTNSVDVIDIKINSEVWDRHNNGGSDYVKRVYTIIYK